MMASVGLGAQDMQNVNQTLQSDNLGNSESLEQHWAMKAFDHAEVYFNLISSVDPSLLHLTAVDDEIYNKFRETFPDMKVDVIDEDEMKSARSKVVWRNFIEEFKSKVDEYNQGTLLRLDCNKGFTEENTTLSVRVQFLAIEIARNRENYNYHLRFTQGKSEHSES